MKAYLWVWVALIATSPVLAGGFDETNREVARTYANHFLKLKDYKALDEVLQEHLALDPDDGGAWNLKGLGQLETGDLGGAARSFGQAVPLAATSEDRAIYRYHHAKALDRQGKSAEAREMLAQCAKDSSSVLIVETGAFPDLEIVPRSTLELGVGFLSGYDSNVLLLPDTALVFTERSATASFASTLSADAFYLKPLGRKRSLDARGVFASTYEYAQAARVFSSIYASGAVNYGWGSWLSGRARHEVGNQFEISFVNTDGLQFFNWTDGLAYRIPVRWNRMLATTLELPLRYQRYAVPDGAVADSNRSGLGIKPKVTQIVSWREFTFTGAFEYEFHQAQAATFRMRAFSIPLSVSRPLPWRLTAIAGVGYTRSSFPDSSDGRVDSTYKISATLTRPVVGKLQGLATWNMLWNRSTTESATFTRYSIMLGVNYAIL